MRWGSKQCENESLGSYFFLRMKHHATWDSHVNAISPNVCNKVTDLLCSPLMSSLRDIHSKCAKFVSWSLAAPAEKFDFCIRPRHCKRVQHAALMADQTYGDTGNWEKKETVTATGSQAELRCKRDYWAVRGGQGRLKFATRQPRCGHFLLFINQLCMFTYLISATVHHSLQVVHSRV